MTLGAWYPIMASVVLAAALVVVLAVLVVRAVLQGDPPGSSGTNRSRPGAPTSGKF